MTDRPALFLDIQTDQTIDLAQLVRLASADTLAVRCSPEVYARMQSARDNLERITEGGQPLYGWNTGFGPHVRHAGDAGDPDHALSLLEHLAVGYGDDTPIAIVRATMILRLLTIARGFSGVRREVFDAYARLLSLPGAPAVPVGGSLGASGDLIPLAHIARILPGRGSWIHAKQKIPGAEVLKELQMKPVLLDAREALALTNGTSSSTAWTLFAWVRGETLLKRAEEIVALAYALLGSSPEALDPALHAARGHAQQERSAANIRARLKQLIADSDDAPTNSASARERRRGEPPPLQEPYSIRAAPQILGALRSQFVFAGDQLRAEIAGVDDNPLIVAADDPSNANSNAANSNAANSNAAADDAARAVHGANFFAQQIAFAADALNLGLCQAGLLAERQLDLLLNPERNGGAPLLLSAEPGRQSGLAGLQLTATALAAEIRSAARPRSVGTIPTNGGNQDIVPMAHEAGRAAFEQTERYALLLGTLAIGLGQLNMLRETGRAPGEVCSLPADWPTLRPVEKDRSLQSDLAAIADKFIKS